MTRNAVAVFGAIRHANEHELELADIAPRVRLSKRQVAAALRDLNHLGLIVRRVDGTRRLWSCRVERRWVQRGVPTRFVEEVRWVTEWENADAVKSAAAPTDTPHTST